MSNSFYRNVFYDYKTGKLYFWETVNSARMKDVYDVEYEYYIQDPTKESQTKDIFGNPVLRRVAKSKEEINQLKESGEKLCESDITQEMKFLQKRYGTIEDIKYNINEFNVCILDIEVASEAEFPNADEAKYPINLISMKINPEGKVYTFGTQAYTGTDESVKNYCHCENEADLLERFITFFRKKSIDIIIGWHLIDFDIHYILNRCEKLNIEKSLSPINKVHKGRTPKGELNIQIAGITLIDYIDLYKKFTKDNRESYSLEFIGQFEVGEGKLDFEGSVNTLYKTDWNKYVEYNVQDVNLVDKIDKKIKYVDLAISVCFQSLVPIEKYGSSVARATGSILKYMHQKKLVLPDRQEANVEDLPGAWVEAKEGFYERIMSFDVESMYPHMIIKYNISPETLRLNPVDTTGLIRTPVEGVYYDRKKGILPEIIEKIFAERKAFRKKQKEEKDPELKRWYDLQQYTRKIWMNSLYGVLANEFFHLYNINNAKVVTLGGQDLIKYLKNSINTYFKEYFHKNKTWFPNGEHNKLKNDIVVLLDTDSLYLRLDEIHSAIAPLEPFLDWAKIFDKEFFVPFIQKILQVDADKYEVNQVINFRREKIISKMFILAKKKYALEVLDDDGIVLNPPEIKITGIEIVRTSTPIWARQKIKNIINEIFRVLDKNTVINILKQYKKEFKQQDIEKIAFPRGISDYEEYANKIDFDSEDFEVPKGCPIGNRAAINFNYLIRKYDIPAQPIGNGTKIKFIYVRDENILHTNIIGFIGNCPDKIKALFKIDYDMQFEKCFLSVIQRFFEVLNWGEISFNNKLEKFME